MDDAPPQEPDPTRTPSAEAGPPLFHTLRVETDAPEGPRTATAFILEYRAEDNRYPFLVTARHVVQEAPEGRITFVPERRARPDLSKGYTLDIENFAKLWFVHPDPGLDVAVTPFVPFVKHIEDSGIPLYFRPLQRLAEEAPGGSSRRWSWSPTRKGWPATTSCCPSWWRRGWPVRVWGTTADATASSSPRPSFRGVPGHRCCNAKGTADGPWPGCSTRPSTPTRG